MFRGSAYLFAVIKYFYFVFLPFVPFATQLFSTPVYVIKPPQPSSATYGAPPSIGHLKKAKLASPMRAYGYLRLNNTQCLSVFSLPLFRHN